METARGLVLPDIVVVPVVTPVTFVTVGFCTHLAKWLRGSLSSTLYPNVNLAF